MSTKKVLQQNIGILKVNIGTISKFTQEDLATIRSKGKYEEILDALLPLKKGECRDIQFQDEKSAKIAGSTILTLLRRINNKKNPGNEAVFKTRRYQRTVKFFRLA